VRKRIASPLAPQPKQWKNCLPGLTEKLGDFSAWNGHKPIRLAPPRLSSTWRPITSTMSTRESRSWMKPVGITAAV
jgi:hypothetical protein